MGIKINLQLCVTFLQTFRIWTAAYFVKTEEREKTDLASKFYNRTLLIRVWRGLKNFRTIRKLKQLRCGTQFVLFPFFPYSME